MKKILTILNSLFLIENKQTMQPNFRLFFCGKRGGAALKTEISG
ncbi:hypothetical protein BMMGA3_10235 [Bacillus methanolicus MGA3]|uniref:Uncharacterized protein n=1 Tax=Bacillus methanolicus (strain MGA3 / ATCC 53907) TaxID=796606 RepID=A0A068LTZ9_BACMM|nr:hypothetical protein BMMGA3_10235 [Bacillus methanolicus MGA3]